MPDYREAAERYRPDKIRVLFIAESPPAYADESKKSYFYFEQNPGSDVLFATIIAALYGVKYRKASGTKPQLLQRLKDDGYWLMDAVESPINRIDDAVVKPKQRAELIRQNIPNLLKNLEALKRARTLADSTGVILIKKVVFRMLEPELRRAGYRVLHINMVGFPGYHRDRRTIASIREALDLQGGRR